jgi:hypothetical protein
MRIRVNSDQVKTDTETGLKRVDTKGAGKQAGGEYAQEFGNELSRQGPTHGGNFAKKIGEGFTLKRALIGSAVTAGLAFLPALAAGAGLLAGGALGGALVGELIKTDPKLKTAATNLKNGFLAAITTSGEKSGFAASLQTSLDDLRTKALPQFQRAFGGVFAALKPLIKPATDALISFSGWLGDHAGPALHDLIGFVTNLKGPVQGLIGQFRDTIWPDIVGFLKGMGSGAGSSVAAFGGLLVVLSPLFPVIGQVAKFAAELLKNFPLLIPIVVGLAAAFKIVNLVLLISTALTDANPWVLLGLALLAVTVIVIKYWTPISGFFVKLWKDIYSGFVTPLENWFTVTLPHTFDTALSHVTGWAKDVENAFLGMWNWVYGNVWTPVDTFFVHTLPSWFDAAIGFVNSKFVTPFRNDLSGAWTWVDNNVFVPVHVLFTSTLPGWLSAAAGFVTSRFVTPFKNTLKEAWTWVSSNVFSPIKTMLTQTLPGWFSTGVKDIGRYWTGLQNLVLSPVKWVFQHVIDPLASGFDTVTNALGLGKPIPAQVIKGWATGGRIGVGTTSTADDVLARVSRNETIVSAAHSRILAPAFGAVGVPGYAAGGTPLPGRGGALGTAIGKAIDVGKIAAAIATGNSTALTNAVTSLIGKPAFQGAGEILKVATAIPAQIIKDGVSWLLKSVSSLAGGSTSAAGTAGSGVQRWKPTVLQALGMEHLPLGYLNDVLYQMQTESGGNQFAINLTVTLPRGSCR